MLLFRRTTTRYVGSLLLLIGLLAAVATPNGEAAPPSRAALVRSLERQGKLTDALRALGTPFPKTPLAKHATRLRITLRALGAAAIYAQMHEYARAQRVLRGALRRLEPGRDVFIAATLHRRFAAIGRLKRASADAEARATLRKADALEADGQHEKAAEAYKVVATKRLADVSEGLIQRAKLGQLHSETAEATDEEGLLGWLWSTTEGAVKTALKWAFYILLAFGAILGLIVLRRGFRRLPPGKRTTLALEDLSASVDERNAKNRTLTQELMTAIRSLGTGTAEPAEAEIDETPDLDGTPLVNLKVVGSGLEGFEATIHDETPFKLGPVSFNPRQVLSLGSAYFRRRSEHELTGALASFGNATLLTVDMTGADGHRPEKRWATKAEGAEARSKALRDMASRIVLDLGGSQISPSWPSFREYREAIAHLSQSADAEKRPKELQEARHAFQRSLNHDPANLLARFNLSNVLRKQGENEAAVEHYSFLQQLVQEQDPRARTSTRHRLLERHPEFPYVVRYNRSVALSKIDSWDSHKKAVVEFERLIEELEKDREEQTHLLLLSRAAWAGAHVFELEKWRHDARKDPRLDARRREVVELLERVRDWVENLPAADPFLELTAYVIARATVQSAVGRAYYLVGRDDEAYEAFERALSMADLGDARVHMASLLMRGKARYPRWNTRAEDHLKRALELSPHDPKARFLLGTLYKDPVFARYEDAKRELAQVDDAWACFHLAEIHARQNDFEPAVAALRRSIYLSPRPDFRSKLYLEYLLSLNQKKAVSIDQLQDGVTIAQRFIKVSTGAQQAAGKRLLSRIRQVLARRKR